MKETESKICSHCGKNTDYAVQPMHLPAGYVLNGKHPYVLGAVLGQGGFGITYIALDMATKERVAIKEYYPAYCSMRTNNTVTAYTNQEDVYRKGKERFLDEARMLKSLSDLHSIVNVFDYFEANRTAYLVMEFLDGSSLKEYALQNGKFHAQKFLSQIKPMMDDIHRMHQRGVIHRDIAPDNIILLPDGQMKLIDFGAARSYLGDKSMTVVVKKGFAPVEQYMSTGASAATDVYALAATVYYCITGIVPPDSAEREYNHTPLVKPSSLGADITQNQESALLNALKIAQKERTQSIEAFLRQLHKTASSPDNREINNVHVKAVPKKTTPANKKLYVAIAAIAIIFAFILFNKNDDASKNQPVDNSSQTTPVSIQKEKPTETQHVHSWIEANCINPKACSICGATTGSAKGHQWIEASCINPKTCSICGATTGSAKDHQWIDATYNDPKTCMSCGATEGTPLTRKAVSIEELGITGGRYGRIWTRSTREVEFGFEFTNEDAPECWSYFDTGVPGHTPGVVRDNCGNVYTFGIHIDGAEKEEYYFGFFLGGEYTTFTGTVACPEKEAAISSYVYNSTKKYTKYFEVYGDGKLLYTSPKMRYDYAPHNFSIDVTNVQTLEIHYPATNGPNEIATLYDGMFS